jgi:hypothetical protein
MAARARTGFPDTSRRRRADELVRRARRAETRPFLPDPEELAGLLLRAAGIHAGFDPSLRPRKDSGQPGGLLVLPPELPVLVLPDLHTRAGLLRRALEWIPPGESRSVLELLDSGEIFLLLLGDLFHSEGPDAPLRWERAYREALRGFAIRAAMDEEMARALSALDVLVRTLIRAPGRVACLKGNHDNSRNREGLGDHGFYKFADEGAMCAAWLSAFTPPGFREALASFEESLPAAALGARFVASHAEPAVPLSPAELVEAAPDTVEALTWTANGQALPEAVGETLAGLLGSGSAEAGARWISGHRPVEGRYALRAEGLLVQIHAPFSFRGAWIRPDRPFDPEADIFDL